MQYPVPPGKVTLLNCTMSPATNPCVAFVIEQTADPDVFSWLHQ